MGSIIPDFVQSVVNAQLPQLMMWFSNLVYAELIKCAPDHPLVVLSKCLDFTRLEAACADYHHTAGPGRPVSHSVAQLTRALLVSYLYKWSLREAEFNLTFNLLVKWFVGYPIFAIAPDHTTLERFEVWVCMNKRRAFFDETLRQIDRDFPNERDKDQAGDTYAVQANATKEPLVPLIRHTCRRLLAALNKADPARKAAVCEQLDLLALFGPPDEQRAYYLTTEERAARLQTTALAALVCANLVRAKSQGPDPLPEQTRAPVKQWLDYLDKVIADNLEITFTATGQAQVTKRTVKGSFRLGSATDPEATWRIHGKEEEKKTLGYNVNLAVTDNFVRAIQADTGSRPDAEGIPEMLQDQLVYQGTVPPRLSYDKAAGRGIDYARVEQATDGRTQLVSRLVDFGQRTKLFGPADFTLSKDGASLTCPNGNVSIIAYRSGAGEGRTFRFFASECAGCPLWNQCRGDSCKPKAHRQVFISDYRAHLEAAQAYNQTPEFKEDMRYRANAERIIAGIVRHNGGRRARRRGLVFADFQAKMNAMAYNLKRWVKLLTTAPVVA